jgi:ketosteroid isomerase-like protein
LQGVYRIDPERSDKLYTVVAGASSNLPFGEQQKFFIDLTVRLTAPDQLAIERRGRSVSIASSRAARVTFEADGVAHRERGADGSFVSTRAALEGQRLSVSVTGERADRFHVTFEPLEGGRLLRVTRRLSAEQLNEPVVIRNVYERVSEIARWEIYGEPPGARDARPARTASRPAAPDRPAGAESATTTPAPRDSVAAGVAVSYEDEAATLRGALADWIDATNGRDIERQMAYYPARLQAFYLARDVTRAAVRAEKLRVFARATSVEIRAESPEIIFTEGGRAAVMRFRKQYAVEGGPAGGRRGEVVQELRWLRTGAGWRITSERDVRVIR